MQLDRTKSPQVKRVSSFFYDPQKKIGSCLTAREVTVIIEDQESEIKIDKKMRKLAKEKEGNNCVNFEFVQQFLISTDHDYVFKHYQDNKKLVCFIFKSHMPILEQKVLRLGDGLNFASKGEIVGVHYELKNQFMNVIESTRDRGKILEWRVGSASVLQEVDLAVRRISLGGKSRVQVSGDGKMKGEGKGDEVLIYQIQLVYIK